MTDEKLEIYIPEINLKKEDEVKKRIYDIYVTQKDDKVCGTEDELMKFAERLDDAHLCSERTIEELIEQQKRIKKLPKKERKSIEKIKRFIKEFEFEERDATEQTLYLDIYRSHPTIIKEHMGGNIATVPRGVPDAHDHATTNTYEAEDAKNEVKEKYTKTGPDISDKITDPEKDLEVRHYDKTVWGLEATLKIELPELEE